MAVSTQPHPSRIGYAICTVGRSGSTWFAELLSSTGELGRPSEYFAGGFQRRLHGPTYPSERKAQIDHIMTEGQTPNGVYALKVFPVHINAVSARLRWTQALPNLRFVHWTRRDVLGQALSRLRATQTQQWRSTLSTRGAPAYDGGAIHDSLRWIVSQDARWALFFARNGIEPLRLVYEDVLQAPQEAVDSVAALLGLATRPVIDVARVAVAVQRDSLTEEWRLRFLAQFDDRDTMDAF